MIITIILLIITGIVTVFYFRNVSQALQKPADILMHVPDDALLVAEFKNDTVFYKTFENSGLFTSILGPDKTEELLLLKKYIFQNSILKPYFENQPVYISIHPEQGDHIDFLITTPATTALKNKLYKIVNTISNPGFKASVTSPGYTKLIKIDIPGMRKSFFISEDEKHIFSASFSLSILRKAAEYDIKGQNNNFLQLPDQQHANALTLLYINYGKLKPFFTQVFLSSNPELLRPFQLFPAQAALNLNYKRNALMFNGTTQINRNEPVSYVDLFTNQQPVQNKLKDIYPATTAYSTTFAISNIPGFIKDLSLWIGKSGLAKKQAELFKQIKAETGVNIDHDIDHQLGNEFSLLITRFQERLAFVELKNGQQLFPSLMNISTMHDGNIGQFNYERIPFYLLGDAFSVFNKPYFTVINNFLLFANTPGELQAYLESYNNQKFLSKTDSYNELDNLSSEQSNVSFFINFKNAAHVFERDMKPAFYRYYNDSKPGLKNFYGMTYQLTAADNNYYTNLCIKLAGQDGSSVDNTH